MAERQQVFHLRNYRLLTSNEAQRSDNFYNFLILKNTTENSIINQRLLPH